MTEIIATISLMGILMAMAVGGLTNYFASKSVETAATELTAHIREAQSLAVATGNTYRIDFSDASLRSYTLQRRSGSQWVNVRAAQSLPGGVTFSASSLPSFGVEPRYLDFYARGNTESGQLTLAGRFSKSQILSIDGETANVR
jgi:Tfp pilus assembly protein FimT